jgi:hypothetical protein
MTRLTIAALAIASVLSAAPALAQAQGSNQAADNALNWSAARGGYGYTGGAYARVDRPAHARHWR